jgi:LysR family transcriptional regulator, transcriptional activator of the cysJI operon
VFYHVVRTRSFSKAAEVMFMTQPGVSNHMAQLEAQIGLNLLTREKGRFELTKEGKTIYKYAERMERVVRELQNTISGFQKVTRPLLKIGTTTTYSQLIMPHILSAFQSANPNIQIRLDSGSSDDMEKTLHSLKNDIAIVANTKLSRNIQAIPFAREELVLITSKKHPLAAKGEVELSDIARYPLIIREAGSATRTVVLEALKAVNIIPSVLIEVKSTDFIKEWVAEGKGISVLIKRVVSPEELNLLSVISLKPTLFLENFVLFLKSRRHNSTIERFCTFISELQMG